MSFLTTKGKADAALAKLIRENDLEARLARRTRRLEARQQFDQVEAEWRKTEPALQAADRTAGKEWERAVQAEQTARQRAFSASEALREATSRLRSARERYAEACLQAVDPELEAALQAVDSVLNQTFPGRPPALALYERLQAARLLVDIDVPALLEAELKDLPPDARGLIRTALANRQ
jgi:hypothetical protein